MPDDLQITLFGELRVASQGADMPLPASRKARALLGFLVATGRPHRRERLCELLWDLPDDPKAALRWSLSKLRQVVDTQTKHRIVADRERALFEAVDVDVDYRHIYGRLRSEGSAIEAAELERMARQLDLVFLDGLDGAGSAAFDAWLISEREDAVMARTAVLRRLVTHPDVDALTAQTWMRRWREADPEGVAAHEREAASAPSAAGRQGDVRHPKARPGVRAIAREPKARATSRALWEQKIGFCNARDGAKIAYATLGSGPPLLKAANWLNHLEFDWASPIWGRSFAAIAHYRTFIRYDERGCGLSDWDVDDLSFEAFVEDLEAVADNLGLERFPLLGISQGAAVSIEYAVRHPERVSGLILIGSYAAGWRHLTDPEEQARREAVLTLTELGWGTDNPAYRHIFSQTFMPDAPPEDLVWFDEFQRQTASPGNAVRFQQAFGLIDVRDRLAEVRAPTIVLHAERDQRIPLEVGRAVADGIPGAQFVPLDSGNHILVESEPAWQECVEAVGTFLEKHHI